MKKTILIEPNLLAKIKRESPAVYEYYSNCPATQFEFVEYGVKDIRMYIQKEVLEEIKLGFKFGNYPIDGLIEVFRRGYLLGNLDLKNRFPGDNSQPMQAAVLIMAMLNLALNYPHYTSESLLNPDNFDFRKSVSYSSISYKEAQYFIAWETIFSRHNDFNDLFVEINAKRKREHLDNMGIIDIGAAFN